ncbi:MAG TPA: response regulator [Ignavibacteriaceae bacterium]|nr:response regulator [Ignavibacteriaceae bacterium]
MTKQKNIIPTILYVEDDDISRELVIMFLKNSFEIDAASDAQEAINKLGSKKYSAVLMDINLGKGLSGLELVKRIKKLHDYKTIPVIAVTAYALREDEKMIMASGCTHYITKPFTKSALLNLVNKAISEVRL